MHSLTSALDGGEWSASRPCRFTPRERAPPTHWIGGWVGPRAEKQEQNKIGLLCSSNCTLQVRNTDNFLYSWTVNYVNSTFKERFRVRISTFDVCVCLPKHHPVFLLLVEGVEMKLHTCSELGTRWRSVIIITPASKLPPVSIG
jgi:hypothetical protein